MTSVNRERILQSEILSCISPEFEGKYKILQKKKGVLVSVQNIKGREYFYHLE